MRKHRYAIPFHPQQSLDMFQRANQNIDEKEAQIASIHPYFEGDSVAELK